MIKKYSTIIRSSIFAVSVLVLFLFQNCGVGSSEGFSTSSKSSSNNSLDISGPQISLFTKPNPITNQQTAYFQLYIADDRSGVDSVEYNHNDGGWVIMKNIVQLKDLPAGDHSIRFRATDKQGNESDTLFYQWKIDLTPPTVSITSSPNVLSHLAQFSSVSNKMNVEFAVTGDSRVVVQCKANGVAVSCSGNKISLDAAVGYYNVSIRVQDEANNVTTKNHAWQVTAESGGLLAPEFVVKPETYDNRTSITVHIRAPNLADMPAGSSLVCKIDGAVKTPCEPNKDLTFAVTEKRVDGVLATRRFRVELNYVGAGTSASFFDWFVDTTAPVLTVHTKPAATVSTNIIPFRFNVSDNSGVSNVTLLCLLDGSPVECLMNQEFSLTVNTSGSHELIVGAVDAAGNTLSENISIEWTNPSCRQQDLSLRWPLKGVEGSDWTIMRYVDQNPGYLSVRDFGGYLGSDAKSVDGAPTTILYAGDHKKVFYMNGRNKVANQQTADVLAMESGVVTAIVRNNADTSVSGVPEVCSGTDNSVKPKVNYIRIKHDNGYVSEYRALSENSIPTSLVVNSRVSKGQKIGSVGSSGCLSYPQLHFSLRNCQDVILDPAQVGIVTDSGVLKYYTQAVSRKAIVMSLGAHQAPTGRTTLTTPEVISRVFEVTSSSQAKKNKEVTLSYVLSNITKSKSKLQYAIIPPGVGSVTNYTFEDPFLAVQSTGYRIEKKITFNRAGRWGIKIYHIYDNTICGTAQEKDNQCTVASIPIDVVD